MGLDKPIPEQLVLYLGDIAQRRSRPVDDHRPAGAQGSARRLPASLELTFTALVIALVIAVPLGIAGGIAAGLARSTMAVRLFCTLGVCVPTFVSGLLLIYVFYYLLGLAPDPTGRIDIFASRRRDMTGFLLIDFADRRRFGRLVGRLPAARCCRP